MSDLSPMLQSKRLSRKTLYENPWINLYVDRVQCPGGRIIEQYHVLEFEKEAVGAVITDPEGRVLLARIYRYPTGRLEWETPGGVIDPGESIVEAARREVLEETGHETADLEHVYSYHPFNGMANKVFHVVRGRATQLVAAPDPNEVREVRWFSRDEIDSLLKENELYDGFTLVALFLSSALR